jgi:hypothetical protein
MVGSGTRCRRPSTVDQSVDFVPESAHHDLSSRSVFPVEVDGVQRWRAIVCHVVRVVMTPQNHVRRQSIAGLVQWGVRTVAGSRSRLITCCRTKLSPV